MNDAIRQMLEAYACKTRDDYTHAIREILQQLALLGLWRSKFFEHAAFYGGTALRILHGLDRYSEDLAFSLLERKQDFTLGTYGDALRRELASFGFEVQIQTRVLTAQRRIESAFLKANTLNHLILVKADAALRAGQHAREVLKIKLEVDTDPPGGFQTVSRPVLWPIPFAVNAYDLPDLFAGKLHALLCRRWKNRVKGRDWYDLVWYLARYPRFRLNHLEQRMRQSGHWTGPEALSQPWVKDKLIEAVHALNIVQARQEAVRYVRDQAALEVWSKEFFAEIIERMEAV